MKKAIEITAFCFKNSLITAMRIDMMVQKD